MHVNFQNSLNLKLLRYQRCYQHWWIHSVILVHIQVLIITNIRFFLGVTYI